MAGAVPACVPTWTLTHSSLLPRMESSHSRKPVRPGKAGGRVDIGSWCRSECVYVHARVYVRAFVSVHVGMCGPVPVGGVTV